MTITMIACGKLLVKNAFGRLKGRYQELRSSQMNNPDFMNGRARPLHGVRRPRYQASILYNIL